MRSIFKRFLMGAALVLTLTSCSSITSYDQERQSFQYLTTENVIDSGSSNGVSYEVFLGDPERKSRKVYYFAESEDTYECILQTSNIASNRALPRNLLRISMNGLLNIIEKTNP